MVDPQAGKCPACGEYFDPEEDEILKCPKCGKLGSTKCCIVGGKGCLCDECSKNDVDITLFK